MFLKGATGENAESEDVKENVAPAFDETKVRLSKDLQSCSGIESKLNKWFQDIPTESHQIDDAVDRVQVLVMKTYSFIRAQVCDQVELFAESFFKLPMLRRLGEDMAGIELSEAGKASYQTRHDRLSAEIIRAHDCFAEISLCIDRLADFKRRCETNAL